MACFVPTIILLWCFVATNKHSRHNLVPKDVDVTTEYQIVVLHSAKLCKYIHFVLFCDFDGFFFFSHFVFYQSVFGLIQKVNVNINGDYILQHCRFLFHFFMIVYLRFLRKKFRRFFFFVIRFIFCLFLVFLFCFIHNHNVFQFHFSPLDRVKDWSDDELRKTFAQIHNKSTGIGVESTGIGSGGKTDDLVWDELDPVPSFPAGGTNIRYFFAFLGFGFLFFFQIFYRRCALLFSTKTLFINVLFCLI